MRTVAGRGIFQRSPGESQAKPTLRGPESASAGLGSLRPAGVTPEVPLSGDGQSWQHDGDAGRGSCLPEVSRTWTLSAWCGWWPGKTGRARSPGHQRLRLAWPPPLLAALPARRRLTWISHRCHEQQQVNHLAVNRDHASLPYGRRARSYPLRNALCLAICSRYVVAARGTSPGASGRAGNARPLAFPRSFVL